MYFQDKAIIAGVEDREGQWEMSCEIVDGLRENKHVLVETVVLLSRLQQKPDDYIEVDIDVIELEGTAVKSKANYDQIKKYVFEQTGLKVSNLYIAQTKKKCGLELGEHFNLPKSENESNHNVL